VPSFVYSILFYRVSLELIDCLFSLFAPCLLIVVVVVVVANPFALGRLEPPLRWFLDVFSRDKTCLFFRLVVFLCPDNILVFRKTHIVEILLEHQLSIHSALEVILRKLLALVVHFCRIVQALHVFLHEWLAFRIVVQGKYSSLRRADILLGCAEIHRRHDPFGADCEIDFVTCSGQEVSSSYYCTVLLLGDG